MKCSDAIAQFLAANDVRFCYGVQGGAVVHLFDSLESTRIKVCYSVYEQSAALACVAASKTLGTPQLCLVTTGPAGTNALTGLLAAWQDSVPAIFISGQTRASHMSYGISVRQKGSQEAPIVEVVRPLTKGAWIIREPKELQSVLPQALQLAQEGRPGPVWIDIPVDVQWGSCEAITIQALAGTSLNPEIPDPTDLLNLVEAVRSADRPLLWLGGGVTRCLDLVRNFVSSTQLPFVTTWLTKGALNSVQGINLGTVGPFGQLGANRAVHEADVILALGSHFSVNQTTSNFEAFAPQARKFVVNIDANELIHLNVSADMKILADAAVVLEFMQPLLNGQRWNWLDQELRTFQNQNVATPQLGDRALKAQPLVDSNTFLANVFKSIDRPYQVIVDGGGTALYAGYQASYSSNLTRLIGSCAISSMGTAMAEAIGAADAAPADLTFVVIGDGSFWMSLQDLPPLTRLKTPVVVIMINNGGYLAIRHTQEAFLNGRFYGTCAEQGLPLGQAQSIAHAVGCNYVKVDAASCQNAIDEIHSHSRGVLFVEVMTPFDQTLLFSQIFEKNADGTSTPRPLSEMNSQ